MSDEPDSEPEPDDPAAAGAPAEKPSDESTDKSSDKSTDKSTDKSSEGSSDAPHDDAHDDAGPARRRGGRAYALVGWTILGVLVLGVVWIVVTGLIARAQLEDARKDIRSLRTAVLTGDTDRAARLVTQIRDKTDTAHDLTTGPAWWIGANLPGIGAPLRTARTIATQSHRLGADALPAVRQLLVTVQQQRRSLSSVDLQSVVAALPTLDRAAHTVADAQQVLQDTDGSWLPVVSSARTSLVSQLGRLDGELSGASRALHLALPMLGQDRKQRYFIGFMNEAEARGGGGIPAAFAIATADRGRVSFEHFGTDTDFEKLRSGATLTPDQQARYGNSDPTGVLVNSNLSPDFSMAARIWAGFWHAKTGERIDGAIALDPTALRYLLKVTGPVTVSGGDTVSADNIVGLTQRKQYSLFPGRSRAVNLQRKQYLVGLARSVSEQLVGGGDPAQLVKALSRAARERRLVVWSAQPDLERQLQDADWAGGIGSRSGGTYSGFVVNNAGGTKLDYYQSRAMTYARADCGAGGRATATFKITNRAPRTGLPDYVTFRVDGAPPGAKPGDNRLLITYFAGSGARIESMSVDGKDIPVPSLDEGDTVTATVGLELRVGRTATVRVTVAEPASNRPVEVLRQPAVQPLKVDLAGDRCGR